MLHSSLGVLLVGVGGCLLQNTQTLPVFALLRAVILRAMARAFLCFSVVMVVLGFSEAGLLGVSHSHSSQNSPDPRAQNGQTLLNLGFARAASPSGRPGQEAMTRPMLDMPEARAREVFLPFRHAFHSFGLS